jgi:hypothetical protein
VLTTRYRLFTGVLLGLAASTVVLPMAENLVSSSGSAPAGALLSDCDGPLREMVIHYVPEAAEVVLPTYRDLVGQLPADVTVHVVCPSLRAYDDLVSRIGKFSCTLSPVIVAHPITCWSRDRWLALKPAEPGDAAVLVPPWEEEGARIWPARLGDQKVAEDLARKLRGQVEVRRSGLLFDGGDFVCDGETVFVTPAVALRNIQRTVSDRETLVGKLSSALGCRVVLLDKAPDHHAGMFMMTVGDRTVLVGDPAAARQQLVAAGALQRIGELLGPDGPDFTDETQQRFDAVAGQCRDVGYRVVRIPLVPGRDGRTYLSYVNVILDQREGRRIVYLPMFDGAQALNTAAQQVWAQLGYEVRRVDCTACYRHFGTLRCLVNVLARGAPTADAGRVAPGTLGGADTVAHARAEDAD